MSYGHDPSRSNPVIIWSIDDYLNIKTKRITSGAGHADVNWDAYDRLAAGRFVINSKICTCFYYSIVKTEGIDKSKIRFVLNSTFGENIRIVEFFEW
jgi:hypothetical protein